MSNCIDDLKQKKTYLGIEFGSTRIKAVLVGSGPDPIAEGAFDWENQLVDGWWSYSLDMVKQGLRSVFADLKRDVKEKYGFELKSVGAMGISAMMHGYIALDENDNLLVPFRTWRNTRQSSAAKKLTELFQFNVPERWSVSHLQTAIDGGEPHTKKIAYLTTLSGYIHYILTGERVLGIGDASGMFPIDPVTKTYNETMLEKFDKLNHLDFKLKDILPRVLVAGEKAGSLTAEGVKYLDETGEFETGIPFCPPEGDAGTGMVATNSVRPATGNISAGTSIFTMVVLEKKMNTYHKEIDVVTTPSGDEVAMIHANTCTSDLDSWVNVTGEILSDNGVHIKKSELYDYVYKKALEGDIDCDGVVSYNFYSGEPVINLESGVPCFYRRPERPLKFANFARSLVYGTLATVCLGMNILEKENISVSSITCHGGLFKAADVTLPITASALGCTAATMKSAGEGGPWGIALLAKYMMRKSNGESLADYLESKVFSAAEVTKCEPDEKIADGYKKYLDNFKCGLDVLNRK